MRYTHPWISSAALAVLCLLSACGGGGSGSSQGGDIVPGVPPSGAVAGPNSFLLFPNPQVLDGGSQQTNTLAYANAYYSAIDPLNERGTLAAFKAKNLFGSGSHEVSITIGDQRDLGYGRKMTGRQNPDGSIAFVVENYMSNAYGGYSSFSLESAIVGATQWHIGTNGIEFSKGPGNTVEFVKFYTFDPLTGARLNMVNLDGRGDKAMPGACISCHGGRADALTPSGLFARVMNTQSQERGDVAAQAHAFEPASFDFSTRSGFSRAALEANMKELNKMVLCTYPIPASETPGAFDGCRRPANTNEYQGTAAAHIKHMYSATSGDNDLSNAASETTSSYLPGDWGSLGQGSLYANTVTDSCRVCHSLRGTGNQSDIDFESFTKFDGYASRIKYHVVDRGNMPLAKLVYDKYWSTPTMYNTMATYLAGKGYADATQRPGRPIADPGPDRVLKTSSTTLSAAMSLYSTSYQWSVSGSAPTPGATLTNANTATPTFTAPGNGTYWVDLVSASGGVQSSKATLKLVVDTALPWDPQALRMNSGNHEIRDIVQGACLTCHVNTKTPLSLQTPPVFFNDYDRADNGDASGTDTNNRHWLYTDVRGRVNFTDIVASPLLRKPSGQHHGGLLQPGFDTSTTPGNAARTHYDQVQAWILNGAPE